MTPETRPLIPLPDKPVHQLTAEEMAVFRRWMGYEPGGEVVPYPTPEEAESRRQREAWKARYAGQGALEPRLLIRQEQLETLRRNAGRNEAARRYLDDTLALAADFFDHFIPEMGPWNPGGNFCPHCIRDKSPEGINRYFWQWDWREPDRLTCPYCGTVFPNADYPEDGALELPRLGLRYTFHITRAEHETADWRLGERAERFVGQPIHMSFSGNIRAMKLIWALSLPEKLGLAYALTGEAAYAQVVERILLRLAAVYGRYPLQSYFQDVVDADPGYAVDNADTLPTVFKRNACIGVYDGRYGYGHEKTTTRVTRVATGLWGSSRISNELSTNGMTFLSLLQGYDLVKPTIAPETRRRIEQDFLLEHYLDVRAYTLITNKAGPARTSRVAFGLVYDDEAEIDAGLEGWTKLLESQYHPDGSMKETPIYGHKPIREELWKVPELLRGRRDLYGEGLYRAAMLGHREITTPLGTQPTLDDSFLGWSTSRLLADIAAARCGIAITSLEPGPTTFALFNTDLTEPVPAPNVAVNRYFEGRHLACLGYGEGRERAQLYLMGEDGLHGHRHACPLNLQLYAGGLEVWPDLGYICDHPGNKWVKATASHQTVVVDEADAKPAGPSALLGFRGEGPDRYAAMEAPLVGGGVLRRRVWLLLKPDGLPVVVDIMEAEGGSTHDYQMRVAAPAGSLELSGLAWRPREALYRGSSEYPLLDFQTAGAVAGGWSATWDQGEQRVRATVLTPCAELIRYRSPGWRSQFEITAQPDKYFDTLALRGSGPLSRFVVVHEVYRGEPYLQEATWTGLVRLVGRDGKVLDARA